MDATNLPGGDLIDAGLADADRGIESIAFLLVSIGYPRLRRLGYELRSPAPNPERRLFDMLARENPLTAHSRYNALIRRLVSFERAAECVR